MQVKVQLAPYLKKKLWPYVWQVAWKDFQVFACTRSPIVGPSLGFLCTRIVFIINPLHLLFFNSQRGKRKTGDLHHYPSLWQLDLARLPYAFFSLQLWCAWFFHLFWSHSHLPEWECYRDLHKMHSCFCLACAFLKLLVLLCSVMWPLPSLWKCKCCGCVLLPRHFFLPSECVLRQVKSCVCLVGSLWFWTVHGQSLLVWIHSLIRFTPPARMKQTFHSVLK